MPYLRMGTVGCFPGSKIIEVHANLCMLCTACFVQCLNTDFVGSTNTINYVLLLSTFTILFL